VVGIAVPNATIKGATITGGAILIVSAGTTARGAIATMIASATTSATTGRPTAPIIAIAAFYARRWSYGDYLPGGWYGSSYYLNAGQFGLPYPPIGCEWVRVGNDALLVDVWSGQVLSVFYGLFW
jgi:hypothetical protein